MRIPTVRQLEAALAERGWVVHNEPYRLNITVLRRTPGTLDAFDDMLCAFWTDGASRRRLWACRCTADPGKPSRENPRRRDGTAVWAVCQVVDGMKLGKHKGDPNHDCLWPVAPIPVLRYTSVDDAEGTPSTSASVQIHRASAVRESTVVGPWSEGCIVIANPTDHKDFIRLCRSQSTPRYTVAVMEWPAG